MTTRRHHQVGVDEAHDFREQYAVRVLVSHVALGLVTIFILCWFAGVLIAGVYNLGVRLGKR